MRKNAEKVWEFCQSGKVGTMIQDSGSFNALNSLCEELFPPMAVQYQLASHL